ncbi:hypothetical protein HYV71_01030 [Candidatus Uhrbacteria bacterium]|nr:hypothetical protein [Candidatus Uhrbacteria bacterium]
MILKTSSSRILRDPCRRMAALAEIPRQEAHMLKSALIFSVGMAGF